MNVDEKALQEYYDEMIDALHMMPIISLWEPWASWVILGWKTIETRTHPRFACLEGRRIGIHAAKRWDAQALKIASHYLTEEQINYKGSLMQGGNILGTAVVDRHRPCTADDSQAALIDCDRLKGYARHGLVLRDLTKFVVPVPYQGKQGIWYVKQKQEIA